MLIPLASIKANANEGQVFTTDFSEYKVGESPNDWSGIWRESNWTIKDDPFRLEHNIDTSGRRGLVWDSVGSIDGNRDLEITTVVRTNGDANGTWFQLGMQISGDNGSENAVYTHIKNGNRLSINS